MLVAILLLAALASPDDRFREGNDFVRSGDFPKGIAAYRDVASAGHESASLYWNWAQAAAARGATGEALWALLRGREIEPGDAAVARDIERLREGANLDPAEIAPVPLAAVARGSRRFHLDVASVVLLGLSLLLHAGAARGPRVFAAGAWVTGVIGLLLAVLPLLSVLASPTAVVVQRGAPLLDGASPSASSLGALREGEVVRVLGEGTGYLRVEDSSGARGWASAESVWRLDRPAHPRADPGAPES
jgi:hypothetical protein